MGPEGDTTEKERPRDRLRSVWVAAGQGVVVVEHSALKLDPLAEEAKVLDLFDLLLVAFILRRQRGNVIDIPDVAGLLYVFVSVNLSLLVGPFWQRLGVSPHSNLRWDVDEFEVSGHGLEVTLALVNLDLEQSIVETRASSLVFRNGCEFLVGGVVRRCDVVGKKDGIGDDVAETNDIPNLDALANLAGQLLHGKDLPVVVGVVMRVSGNLLSLRRDAAIVVAKRVAIGVAVKVDLRLLVTHGDRIVVVDPDRLESHYVVAQSLLELWCHEVVARAGPAQDSEVDLEPEQVEKERNNDEAHNTSSKVLAKFWE